MNVELITVIPLFGILEIGVILAPTLFILGILYLVYRLYKK
jgi:hypothetical protein